MFMFLIAYALIGAIVLGWLICERTRDPDGVPLHVLLLMPLLWLPVLICVAILLTFAFFKVSWDRRFF